MPYKDPIKGKENKRLYYYKNKERLRSQFRNNYQNKKQEYKNRVRIYRKNNREKVNSARRNREKILKKLVYNEYGNKCACCGETIKPFLTIDHINNDGHIHRKKTKNAMMFYLDIIKQGFPKTEYRILCWNCNCGRRFNNGVCPHKHIAE